ncbi:MAG TPA: twin-arginine translocase subunit TatC [Fimbriimonadaceae bacterium]|nr:twin-arginine translocase subunit TatC [Fimbriimonadaceae bacterium]
MAALFKNPGPRNSSDDPEEFRATLVEHLEELRTRIIRIVWMLIFGWVAGWYLFQPWASKEIDGMIARSVWPILDAKHIHHEIVWHTATEAFMFKLKFTFMLGFIAVFPLTLLQVWGFVSPALKPNEKRPFKVLVPCSVLLFLLGAGFAWWVTPNALQWFTSYIEDFPGTALFQEAGTLTFFVLKMLLAFGLAFQLPIIVYALGAIGLLQSGTLLKYWRQSTVVIFIISAVLTPSNDAFTMLMMALPMCVLFMISVYLVRFTQRKKKRREEDEKREDDAED